MNAPLDAGQRASLEAALNSVTLDDKYTLERGRAYMSGIQALVRLPMLQQERDKAAGLNTAVEGEAASRRAPGRVPARRQ
jgi:indolepyruvate ferredoxin oxidoreductase